MSKNTLADVIRPGAGRGLDFVILPELRKRTGITKPEIVKFAVSEMLCNSLDTDATTIKIGIKTENEFDEVNVWDNGTTKITLDDLKLILDFTRKASSKRGFLRVSRGYLGNALKCLFGYSYALAVEKKFSPPEIHVNSHGIIYRINLKPDKVTEIIDSDVSTTTAGDLGNSFAIKFPSDLSLRETKVLHDIILATSMVNPTRKICYDLWGLKGEVGRAEEAVNPRKDTSVIWYTQNQFKLLFKDFVRAKPNTYLKDFIGLFRGFTGTKKHKEILSKLNSDNMMPKTVLKSFYLQLPSETYPTIP